MKMPVIPAPNKSLDYVTSIKCYRPDNYLNVCIAALLLNAFLLFNARPFWCKLHFYPGSFFKKNGRCHSRLPSFICYFAEHLFQLYSSLCMPAKKSHSPSSSFFEDVWAVVRQIPPGRVSSYGDIAAYLGTKLSARMVGWAMNAAHALPDVPAHRVVNRNGCLSGKAHFATPQQMEALLQAEGVLVQNDQVVQFQQLRWDPAKEIGL
jgi:methylated-DNA-protein-cysteine methyltransferase-like protein